MPPAGPNRANRVESPPDARGLDAGLTLRELLNPTRRASVAGMARRRLVVGGVWPDEHGFSARLDGPRHASPPIAWVRWRDGLESWRFPEDPELPALAELIERDYGLLAHRLARRAALLTPGGDRVVHLHPPRAIESVRRRWAAIHTAIETAGVPVAGVLVGCPEAQGISVEFVRGDATGDSVSQARMSALGEVLARAHAVAPPPGLTPRGLAPALDATVRQLGLAVHSRTRFTQWLERRLERWRLLGAAARHSNGALVHGELHPGHIVWRDTPTILDWDRAGAGDAEEDLGNLAAHFYWESGAQARDGFVALRRSYAAAGGSPSQGLFEHYARLALVRLLAVRALRELDQTTLNARHEEWAAWPEVVSDW